MIRSISRWVLGGAFVLAGANHFWRPAFYVRIIPPYLPAPLLLVYVSGAAEAGLGALLLIPRTTRLAAWGLIALLAAVFPANVHMALHASSYPYPKALLWWRLPFQGVLIAWAYWHTRKPAGIETKM